MERLSRALRRLSLGVACAFFLSGCSTTLVRDEVRRTTVAEAHCSGGEWVDDSSIAVLPVPVVAFFVPHVDLNEIKGAEYVNRCGEPARVINRDVTVDRTACIPAGLTRIITLGVWQWCPAYVSWTADVKAASEVSGNRSSAMREGGNL
ncbi:MAG: hypothetical protein KatS3mg082_2073 [Nitrospiraceae bacterium]|nr:MAG: hypothetical protein KatS3mg082_2073 [Nitrospiraceae bacterium]